MADHDDARGTLTDDPVEIQDDAGTDPGPDPVTRQLAGKARVVRRKPARLGALKRTVARPVRPQSSDASTGSVDIDTESTPEPAADTETDIAVGTVADDVDESADGAAPRRPGRSKPRAPSRWLGPRRLVMVVVAVLAAALCVTAGLQWRGLQDEQDVRDERQAFLQAGRQGALNLTTIRWDNADSDVQRILDGAGDPFRKDFADRSKSFIAVVKEAKSTSTGEIAEAGIASVAGNTAQVIVSATVKTSNVGAAEQEPRAWRMKVSVEKKDNRMLVTNVEFVP
jgi:Mce-associated membrane protein